MLAQDSIKKLELPDSLGERVHDLILATRHVDVPADHAGQVLMDADLAILGKSEREFDAYETGIRAEYGWVSPADFRSGRSRVLREFLDRPSIYATKAFRDKYEDTARKNLERSIERLRE